MLHRPDHRRRERPKEFAERRVSALLVRAVVIFIGLQVAALAAVAAGELIPDRAILDELHGAVSSGAITATNVAEQRTGGFSDHYGECVLLGVGLGAPEGHSLFATMARSPTLHSCPSMINRLNEHASSGHLSSVSKIRYWNGLSVITRLALATVGVDGLRTLAMLSLAGSVALLAKTVSAAIGGWSALALLGPVVAAGDLLGLVEVFHHPLMLSVAFVGIAALARGAARDWDWSALGIAAFVVGSMYSFVNLMNFVPGLWAMSAAVVAGCVPAERNLAMRARRMVAAAIAWPAGYLSMWAGKWVWAAVATSPSAVVDEISGTIRFRLNGESQFTTGDLGAGLRANLSFWLDQALVPAVLMISGLVLVVGIGRAVRRDPRCLSIAAVIAGPVLILVPWLLVTNNHNEIHYWFEYRSLPMALGVVLMALCIGSRNANYH